jgi:hypothetical protein
MEPKRIIIAGGDGSVSSIIEKMIYYEIDIYKISLQTLYHNLVKVYHYNAYLSNFYPDFAERN